MGKFRALLILVTLPLVLSTPNGYGQGVPIPGRAHRGPEFAAKLHEFDRKYQVTSRGSNDSGFVNRAVGVLSEPLDGRDPFEVALQFFEENKELFGMRDPRSELVVWEGGVPDKRTGVVHARFHQVLKGVRVDASHASAHFGRDGRLKSIDITYTLGLNPEMRTEPQLTAQSVLAQSSAALQMGRPLMAAEQELLIYQRKLTWFLRTPSGEYHIDANSGETLHWWDGKRYNVAPPPTGIALRILRMTQMRRKPIRLSLLSRSSHLPVRRRLSHPCEHQVIRRVT